MCCSIGCILLNKNNYNKVNLFLISIQKMIEGKFLQF